MSLLNKKLFTFLHLCTLLIGHLPLHAEEAELLEYKPLRITPPAYEEVNSDRLGNRDVVREEQLLQSHGSLLLDSLESSSSVFVQSTTPGQSSPYIRGLTGSSVLSLVDGMRLNHAMYRSAPNQDLALVDPFMIESLSVLYGPNSVRYGSDALGGVVYARSRQAKPGMDQTKTRTVFKFNSAELLKAAHSHIESNTSDYGVILGATVQDSGNRKAGGYSNRLNHTDYGSYAGFLNLAYEPTSESRTNITLQYLRQPKTSRYDELVPGFGQEEPSSSEFLFKPNKRFFTHIEQQLKNQESTFFDQLFFDLSYQLIRDDRQQRDFNSAIRTNEKNRSDLFEAAVRAELQVTEATALSYGADSSYDVISSGRTNKNLDSGITETVQPRFPDNSHRSTAGLYSFVDSEVVEDLTLSAGIRYTFVKLKLAETTQADSSTFSLDDFSWSTGLRWQFVNEVDFVSSFSRGFRAPNIFDLGALGPRPGGRFNIANTSLKPEELYSYDLGLQTKQEDLSADFHLFLSHYDDRIASALTGELTAEGRTIVQSQNLTDSVIYGVESSFDIKLLEQVRFKGVATWNWGENKLAGITEPGDRIPPLFGSSSLEWNINDNFKLVPYMKFAGNQDRLSSRDVDDPRINPNGTAGWATFGISTSWHFHPGYKLTSAIDNIADKNYRIHGSGIDATGRSIMVMLDIEI